MKKFNNRIKEFIKAVIKMIRKPVMSILPGQLSFFLLLSLIPMILILSVVASLYPDASIVVKDLIKASFPGNASELLIPLLNGVKLDSKIIVIIFSALLLVSKGTRSIIRVSSILYNIEDSNTFRDIVKSFLLSILLTLLISFIIIIPIFGSTILEFLHNFKIISNLTDNILVIYNLLKWPISILIIFITIKLIYKVVPNKGISFKTVNTGALFTTILWVLVTYIYSFYIDNFSSYSIFYGGSSSIIILMLWIYIISYIFVLGMSINANYEKIQE